jgi:hypothetical protein
MRPHTGLPDTEPLMPDRHVSSVGFERASDGGEGAIARDIEDEIIANATFSKVFPCMIDHLISSRSTEHPEFTRTTDGGHMCASGPRDLQGDGTHATRTAVDQHGLTRSWSARITEVLQGDVPAGSLVGTRD